MKGRSWLQAWLALLLVLFLPGYTLIMAMFPRKNELDEEFDTLYRVTLGMAMSICVVILIGFVLGNPGLGNAPAWEGISDGEKGWFQTFFVATSLLAATALFFAAGWYRGAYPWLARRPASASRQSWRSPGKSSRPSYSRWRGCSMTGATSSASWKSSSDASVSAAR